ncbi:MAG: hypothetical protein WCS77_07915 [Elusimicrobiaceae bacterium]
MQHKLTKSALLAAAVVSFSLGSGHCWDQLGSFKYNSHSVITTDAVLGANKTLRSSRKNELDKWSENLYDRVVPRILTEDPAPMGVQELAGGFYPEKHLDDGTGRTLNRLQQGNTAADWPVKLSIGADFLRNAYCRFQSRQLGVTLTSEECNKLPNIGIGMTVHFTREYKEIPNRAPALMSAGDSCRKSVATVRALTKQAFAYWKHARTNKNNIALEMREYELMYFFLGVASHAIEDSFAPAHMQRDIRNPKTITDVCYYYDNNILPPTRARACAHALGAGNERRDSIYFTGDTEFPQSNLAYRSLATQAAQAYLTGFANVALDTVNGTNPSMDAFLDKFLLTGTEPGMGYFNCATLTN